jgi:hypothetical protein
MNDNTEDSNGLAQESQIQVPETININLALQLEHEKLSLQLRELEQSTAQMQREFSSQLEKLQTKKKSLEEALNHINALLRFKGQVQDSNQNLIHDDQVEYPAAVSITDAAYDFLVEKGTPTHFKDITNHLLQKDICITGKDPAATLLSRIVRDKRFKRTKRRGTYALTGWNARRDTQSIRNKSKKKRKRRRIS